jgi:hypothetical protein
MFTGAFDRPDLKEVKVLLEGLSTYLITPSALTTSSAVKVRNWHFSDGLKGTLLHGSAGLSVLGWVA